MEVIVINNLMLALFLRILGRILSIFSLFIPKSSKILVFSSFPDYTDNPFAVYSFMQKCKRYSKYRYIWIYVSRDSVLKDKNNVEAYYKNSLLGLWYFFRAKYIFCSHGLNSYIRLHQGNKIVNLWHGMPLKVIGSLDEHYKGDNPTKADFLIATSPLFQEIMSKSFNNIDLNRVIIVGQPRNDLLFNETDFFINHNIDVTKYRKIGIWLPTYRCSILGDKRIDGVYSEDRISYVSLQDLDRLNDLLKQFDDLLIVKIHPMDILQLKVFPKYSNIIILKQNDLKEQLYPLLGGCSYLLTDYSSVWVDYEILGKPIGFVIENWKEYSSTRGFTIDNLIDLLPGPILSNYEELCNFIIQPPTNFSTKTDIFNIYKDNKSTERLLSYLEL